MPTLNLDILGLVASRLDLQTLWAMSVSSKDGHYCAAPIVAKHKKQTIERCSSARSELRVNASYVTRDTKGVSARLQDIAQVCMVHRAHTFSVTGWTAYLGWSKGALASVLKIASYERRLRQIGVDIIDPLDAAFVVRLEDPLVDYGKIPRTFTGGEWVDTHNPDPNY